MGASNVSAGGQNRLGNADDYVNVMDYKTKGTIVKLADNTEVYAHGNRGCKNGVLIIPDYFGWYTGRVRNVCDLFGDSNCFSVIPNFGSHGYEPVKSYAESDSILDWYKARTFDGHIKPTIKSTVEFMKGEGCEKIALLGFSWGSWVAVNVLASELSEEFVCAALPHPSLTLEESMYGGSLPELMSRVNRPFLLMPTMNDPEAYKGYVKLLQNKLPSCQLIDTYHNMDHGFIIRGNIDHEIVTRNTQKALEDIYNYFQAHYTMKPSELVKGGNWDSMQGNLKTFAQTAKDKANSTMGSSTSRPQNMTGTTSKPQNMAGPPHTVNAQRQNVGQGFTGNSMDMSSGTTWGDTLKSAAVTTAENLKTGYNVAKEYAKAAAETVGAKVSDDSTKAKANDMKNSAKSTLTDWKNTAKTTFNDTKDSAKTAMNDAKDSTKSTFRDARDSAKSTMSDAKDSSKAINREAKDSVQGIDKKKEAEKSGKKITGF